MTTKVSLPLPKSNEGLLRLKAEIENITRPNHGFRADQGEVDYLTPYVTIDDAKIIVSAEDGGFFANYYGECDGEDGDCDPWIHPKLETWAESRGWYWEWENPGAIVLCN